MHHLKPLPVLPFAIQNPTAMQFEMVEYGHCENYYLFIFLSYTFDLTAKIWDKKIKLELRKKKPEL